MSAARPGRVTWAGPLLRAATIALCVTLGDGCVAGGQQVDGSMAVSSDPELAKLASRLLPELARRSGMSLRRPVAVERRSRAELVRYLRSKLDEELPPERAASMVRSYALLGLLPDTLDLRAMLLDVYTEQVAGFYEPDSTALFVLDDQPEASLEPLMVHELVHAVQDQSADLDSLADPARGNDRSAAAKAVIEGHATLVMLEYLAGSAGGRPVDIATLPDFGAQLRPALAAMRAQFPALTGAPALIQETLLFPYIEGTAYVQSLWSGGERVSPFGSRLPESTEQILTHDASDRPVAVTLDVSGGTEEYSDVLGRLETGLLLAARLGPDGADLATGWGGDRYVLVRRAGGGSGLVWCSVWDDAPSRDRFVRTLSPKLDELGAGAELEVADVDGRPGALLRVGEVRGISVRAHAAVR